MEQTLCSCHSEFPVSGRYRTRTMNNKVVNFGQRIYNKQDMFMESSAKNPDVYVL